MVWRLPLAACGLVLAVLLSAPLAEARVGKPRAWSALDARARRAARDVRARGLVGYRSWLHSVEAADPQLREVLRAAGLSSEFLPRSHTPMANWRSLAKRWMQVRAVRSTWQQAERDGLGEILGRHLWTKNERWREAKELVRNTLARLAHPLSEQPSQRIRSGVERAEKRLALGLERMRAVGLSEPSIRTVRRAVDKRLQEFLGQTRHRFPDAFPHAPGSAKWWRWLSHYGQLTSRNYDRFQPIVDGPAWRKKTSSFIRRAEGFLHIASFRWHYDESGRWLAHQLIARKLGLPFKELSARLTHESVEAIRDQVLAGWLVTYEHRSKAEAEGILKGATEEWKREAVNRLSPRPLETRVLLPSLTQAMGRAEELVGAVLHRRRAPRSMLDEMRAVGVNILLHHKVLQLRPPFLHLHNLGAVIPHAKLMISRDEALTGGLNIGNFYLQKRRKDLVWHDVAVQLRGPAAHGLNWSFVRHWNGARGERSAQASAIDPERKGQDGTKFYFPDLHRRVRGRAVVVGTNAQSVTPKARYTYRMALVLALASARHRFRMVVPYLTSPVVVEQLVRTAERFRKSGVDPANIEVIITGYNDHFTTSTAVTGHSLYQLQQAGIKVLLWKPRDKKTAYRRDALHHAKVWTVDDRSAYIGSANAMVRSLVQDWEIGIITDNPGSVANINRRLFDRDLPECVPFVPPPAWKRYLGHGLNLLLGPVLRLQ